MIKLVKPKKASPRRLEETVSETVEDICLFHRYFEGIYADRLSAGKEGIRHQEHMIGSYTKMQEIADKYPQNNSLKNKLDKARGYVWPHGKR